MEFLAGADANFNLLGIFIDCCGNVTDIHRRYLLDVDLTALHVVESMPYQINAVLKRDHESGHTLVGYRKPACFGNLKKIRDHRPAGAHDISVSDH